MALTTVLAVNGLTASLPAAEPARKREWQPVQEYITTIDPLDAALQGMIKGQRINPFLSYTAIGTDYGFLGPDASVLAWSPQHIHVRLTQGQWAGIWHSLTKRGMDAEWMLDFQRCYPPWFTDAFQARITGVKFRGHGHGQIKVEIKTNKQEVIWSDGGLCDNQKEDIDAYRELPKLGKAKYLNWIASTDSELSVNQIALEVEMPPVPFDMEVFLKSYAKLSICYSMKSGMVADRAHVETGAFDCVPASGMFCLASAAAAHHGITTVEFARGALRRIHETTTKLDAPRGVLPHFIRQIEGRYRIHPGTEYSTVDTAIYYHSMLLAARMLGDDTIFEAVRKDMQRLDFKNLRDAEGYIFHGLKEDGTPLAGTWRDWGGETALVLLLQRAVDGPGSPALMHRDGKVWQGTGFISEIQSLFYPQFDLARPDTLTGNNWPGVRTTLLKRQQEYFPANQTAASLQSLLRIVRRRGRPRQGLPGVRRGSARSGNHPSALHPDVGGHGGKDRRRLCAAATTGGPGLLPARGIGGEHQCKNRRAFAHAGLPQCRLRSHQRLPSAGPSPR